MATNGAHAPGCNVQVAATPDHGFIVAILATDRRNDTDLASPMVARIERRPGQPPAVVIAGQGHASAADSVALAMAPGPTTVYAPVPAGRAELKPQSLKRRKRRRELEPDALKQWRARMNTAEAAMKIKRRKRIELVNAHLKAAGFARQVLRGLAKIQTNCVLHALAHTLRTATRVRAAA